MSSTQCFPCVWKFCVSDPMVFVFTWFENMISCIGKCRLCISTQRKQIKIGSYERLVAGVPRNINFHVRGKNRLGLARFPCVWKFCLGLNDNFHVCGNLVLQGPCFFGTWVDKHMYSFIGMCRLCSFGTMTK